MINKSVHQSAVIDFQGELTLPSTTIIEPMVTIYGGIDAKLTFGEMNIIYPSTSIRIDQGFMETGVEVSFGTGCHIYEPREGLIIGDYTMIAGGPMICGVEHGRSAIDIPMRKQASFSDRIVIEDDVWVGMRVVISAGVTIGKGSIIGAGSVVMEDIPEYSIAYGTPCKVVRKRE